MKTFWIGLALAALAGCHPAATSGTGPSALDASAGAPPPIVRAPGSLPREARPGEVAPATECASDADCVLTLRMPSCCPRCEPTALPEAKARDLENRCQGKDAACVQPLCRAPRAPPRAICVQGRCAVGRGQVGRE